jgi:hypothetical protein
VNTAARLEQTAEPGTIVIGDLTYRLVRDSVEVTSLAAKGKAKPVDAYRIDAVMDVSDSRPEASARLIGIGRLDEAELLATEALARVRETDLVTYRAEALETLAKVKVAGGHPSEARHYLNDAHDIYRRKQAVVSLRRVEEILSRIADPTGPSQR